MKVKLVRRMEIKAASYYVEVEDGETDQDAIDRFEEWAYENSAELDRELSYGCGNPEVTTEVIADDELDEDNLPDDLIRADEEEWE